MGSTLTTVIIIVVLIVIFSVLYYFERGLKRVDNLVDIKIEKDGKQESINQAKNTENTLVYSTKENSTVPEKSAFALELEKAQRKQAEREDKERQEREERQRKQAIQRSNHQVEQTRRERQNSDSGLLHNQVHEVTAPSHEPSCSPSSDFESSNSSSYSSSDTGGSSSYSCD